MTLEYRCSGCGKLLETTNADDVEQALAEAVAAERERCAQLRQALQDMLDLHGRPHREEWINEQAYQHACEVHKRCAAAIRKDVSPSPASSPAPDCPSAPSSST